MTHLRPRPDDFPEVAAKLNSRELREHYRTGERTITRWYREAGITPLRRWRCARSDKMPVPADFHLWADKENSLVLRKRYGVSDQTISRWRRETGIKTPYRSKARRRPVPDDFAEIVRQLGRNGATVHYGVSTDLIGRWMRECGLSAKRNAPVRFKRAAEKRLAVVMDNRDGSEASRAQSYLQRFYPVWRCDELGRFDPKGSHFRCDGITRTQEEMIERAVRKGWQRDDWRRIAA